MNIENRTILLALKELEKRYEEIGYKIPKYNKEVKECYYDNGDMNPAWISEDNNTLSIDTDAYEDMAKNKEAALFYLGHEMAHLVTNANHGDAKFERAVKVYNSKFNPNILSDPDSSKADEYNKKLLPEFYKKDEWFSKQKTDKDVREGIKNKSWKIFNY